MAVNELQDGGKITVKTLDEQEHVNMLLDILRGVNLQDKLAIKMTIASFHPHCNKDNPIDPDCLKAMEESAKRQAGEEPEKQQAEKTSKRWEDAFDSDAIDTMEYGFCYVNGVLTAAQRISEADSDGQSKEVPADFYWIVDEARQRLGKIRVLLGFLDED